MKNKMVLAAMVLAATLTGCTGGGGSEGEEPELGYEWVLPTDKDRETGITARSEFLTYGEDALATVATPATVDQLDVFRHFNRTSCDPRSRPNGIMFTVADDDTDVVYEVIDRAEGDDTFKVYSPYTGSRTEYGVYDDVTYECLERGASPSETFPATYSGEMTYASTYVLEVIKANFEYVTGAPVSDNKQWLVENMQYIDVIEDCNEDQFHDAFLTVPTSEVEQLLSGGRPTDNTLLMTTSTIDPYACYGYGRNTPNLEEQAAEVMECSPLPVPYTCVNVHK